MPTPALTIQYAKISQYLADDDIANGDLFGARLDPSLGIKLYVERVAIEKVYNADSSYIDMQVGCDYLYALCGRYGLQAQYLTGNGLVAVPESNTPFDYLIPITGAAFTNATQYDDSRIVGKQLQIFWQDRSNYLLDSEWGATATGLQILIPSFDATANPEFEFKIYIVNP